MRRSLYLKRTVVWLGLVVVLAQVCGAYSVLTHEQVVDFLWKDDIQPLLQKRFPAATDDDLKKAHAYAYGGSLVQDMGYYPFGNKYFSDLTSSPSPNGEGSLFPSPLGEDGVLVYNSNMPVKNIIPSQKIKPEKLQRARELRSGLVYSAE